MAPTLCGIGHPWSSKPSRGRKGPSAKRRDILESGPQSSGLDLERRTLVQNRTGIERATVNLRGSAISGVRPDAAIGVVPLGPASCVSTRRSFGARPGFSKAVAARARERGAEGAAEPGCRRRRGGAPLCSLVVARARGARVGFLGRRERVRVRAFLWLGAARGAGLYARRRGAPLAPSWGPAARPAICEVAAPVPPPIIPTATASGGSVLTKACGGERRKLRRESGGREKCRGSIPGSARQFSRKYARFFWPAAGELAGHYSVGPSASTGPRRRR